MSKSITELPSALQELFAELQSEQKSDNVDGTSIATTSEDVMDEFIRIDTEVEADPIDENDENQIDMGCVSPEMLAMFN